jgi:hypothetical protein
VKEGSLALEPATAGSASLLRASEIPCSAADLVPDLRRRPPCGGGSQGERGRAGSSHHASRPCSASRLRHALADPESKKEEKATRRSRPPPARRVGSMPPPAARALGRTG